MSHSPAPNELKEPSTLKGVKSLFKNNPEVLDMRIISIATAGVVRHLLQ
jgi:hypothetical protein